MFSVSLSSFITKKIFQEGQKRRGGGNAGRELNLSPLLTIFKMHPLLSCYEKIKQKTILLFDLFIPILFLRVVLSCNILTSEL